MKNFFLMKTIVIFNGNISNNLDLVASVITIDNNNFNMGDFLFFVNNHQELSNNVIFIITNNSSNELYDSFNQKKNFLLNYNEFLSELYNYIYNIKKKR